MKTKPPTAVRPSESFLAISFLGMLAGTIIAAATTQSALVLVGGVVLTIVVQRTLVGGRRAD